MCEALGETKDDMLDQAIAMPIMLSGIQFEVEQNASFSITSREDFEAPFVGLFGEVVLED